MPNPSKKPFINPLTQSTISKQSSKAVSDEPQSIEEFDSDEETNEERNTAETETDTATETSTNTSTVVTSGTQQSYEVLHERITLWVDKGLKERLDTLADNEGLAKAALLDDALADLLQKYTTTYTSTIVTKEKARRKRGAQAFERTHERITRWVDKDLKEQFDQLAERTGFSKTTLIHEAITDLLVKLEK